MTPPRKPRKKGRHPRPFKHGDLQIMMDKYGTIYAVMNHTSWELFGIKSGLRLAAWMTRAAKFLEER